MRHITLKGRWATNLAEQQGRHGVQFALTRSRTATVVVRAAQPCLLLTNDDGVESPALQSLAGKLRTETGQRVIVVAPARNKSAASMGLTLRYDMELRTRPDLGPDTYALSDCMMVALDATKGLMRALDLHPIMALSGPNYGPNMGTDVLLSGTVGAARAAGLYGVPSLASSSTSLDKASTLDNAVEATRALAELALDTLGRQPARNWPRNHIVVGVMGRRHTATTCEYDALPHNWVLDVEQVLLDAFLDGDVFLNLNVPADWQQGPGRVQTTGLGLMFYKDSYVVSVPGRAPAVAEREPALVAAGAAKAVVNGTGNGNGNGNGSGNGFASTSNIEHGSSNGNGNGNGVGAACSPVSAVEDIAQALAAGLPVVYNNAYDTRRIVPVGRSDVMALQAGDMSISTLQTWPEGHTLCLSDRVMARALLSAHNGMPAWLQSRVRA